MSCPAGAFSGLSSHFLPQEKAASSRSSPQALIQIWGLLGPFETLVKIKDPSPEKHDDIWFRMGWRIPFLSCGSGVYTAGLRGPPEPLSLSARGGAEEAVLRASLSPEPALAPWRGAPQSGLFAMGSLLLLMLLLLLSPSYPRGGSARRRRSARTQGPGGPSPAPPETSAPFWVRISPELKAVPPGGSVWLNCSSSCPLPEGSSLRTELRRGDTLSGPGWVSYQLLDVRAWSSDVHCFVTCAGETRGATARITAYSEGQGLRPGWGAGRRTERG